MSAFMVDKPHIDAIVATALYGPTDNGKPGGYGQTRWYGIYFGNPSRKLQTGDESASMVGEMLVKENLSSIHYRYPDTITDPDRTPGPHDPYYLREYVYPRHAKPLTIVQALKALGCYEYQACEHPEWHTSEARRFCDHMRKSLCSALPGYDEAEWEVAA